MFTYNYIFIKIFNKANTSNTTNIPAIYLNVSFVKKFGDHTNAISIIVPNNINKVNVIRGSIFICKYYKAYKKIYKFL